MSVIPPPLPALRKLTADQQSRPMLARDADSMYWMARYVERAEHIARLLLVNANVLVDVGDLAPEFLSGQWRSILEILNLPPLAEDPSDDDGPALAARVARHLTFGGPDNPNSLVNCVTRARENARAIRENISAEMWESLNTLYWSLRGDDVPARFEESPEDVYRQVMVGSMLFQGLTDQTLPHEQPWLFTQLGKYLERTLITARIIGARYALLRRAEAWMEAPLRHIHWMAVLRSCCSLEAYRRLHVAETDPERVAAFVVLHGQNPRSVRFAVARAHEAIRCIHRDANPLSTDPAERVLGRLTAALEYTDVPAAVSDTGLAALLASVQEHINDAAIAVQQTYFLH